MDCQLESMRKPFEEKLDAVLAKQIEISRELETSWNISHSNYPKLRERVCENLLSSKTMRRWRTTKEKQIEFYSESLKVKIRFHKKDN